MCVRLKAVTPHSHTRSVYVTHHSIQRHASRSRGTAAASFLPPYPRHHGPTFSPHFRFTVSYE
jgi:hypothetical protein